MKAYLATITGARDAASPQRLRGNWEGPEFPTTDVPRTETSGAPLKYLVYSGIRPIHEFHPGWSLKVKIPCERSRWIYDDYV
jgi:hypothetical protein